MTTLQFAFNNIQRSIDELKEIQKFAIKGFDYWIVKDTIKILEIKLSEIAIELTAERHATQY